MNNQEKGLTFLDFTLLWCGAAISIAEILTGGLLADIGFKQGLLAIVLGHIIGTTIFIFAGIIGTRENVPAITSTRISFGLYGSYLFSILNVIQLIGWTAVMVKSAADSLNMITKNMWNISNVPLWSIIIAILIILWIMSGTVGFKKINTIAVILLFFLTIILGWVTFRSGKLEIKIVKNTMPFGNALELVIAMPLSWLPMVADYTRFAKSEKQGACGSFLGYFIGSCWMFIIGLGAAIVSKNYDPSAMMLKANLGLGAVFIVVLSTVTTTFMDAYSAGVTFLNVFPKFNEKIVAVVMTVIGTLLSMILNMNNYSDFLYAIGSVFAPLFAILLTDYFIVKKHKKIDNKLNLNIGAAIIWILGVALYYIFIRKSFIVGATLPSMFITGLIYFVCWRYVNKWRLIKK